MPGMSQTTDMIEPHQSRAARERRAAAERARRHRAAQKETFDAIQAEVEALRAEVARLRDAAVVHDAIVVGVVRAAQAYRMDGRIRLRHDEVSVPQVVEFAAFHISGRDLPRYKEAVSCINARIGQAIDTLGLK